MRGQYGRLEEKIGKLNRSWDCQMCKFAPYASFPRSQAEVLVGNGDMDTHSGGAEPT